MAKKTAGRHSVKGGSAYDSGLRAAVAERREELRRLIYAALFLALAFLLPFLTANNRALNTLISPMHIPAFLCGLICGPGWGAAIGFCAPLLRSVALGMPPIPMAACMAFELVYAESRRLAAEQGNLKKLLSATDENGRPRWGTAAAEQLRAVEKEIETAWNMTL
jgi:hypothetical protein